MKTEKLYDVDSYIKEFDARVLDCIPDGKGRYGIILDRTAFFPEEGGQGCDLGTLGDARVLDVRPENGEIMHFTEKPFAVGEALRGEIDFERRRRHMQNHSGEHIVSGIVHNLYKYNNVGFHLGESETTCDFDGELDAAAIDEIERLANEAVVSNLSFRCWYPSAEELSRLEYRSKLELQGGVRIVEIEGLDRCACCAPHVKKSGEIGMIKIISFMRYKGGVRLTILCGFDALADYRRRLAAATAVSNRLSVKKEEIAEGVERLVRENEALRLEAAKRKRSLIASELRAMKSEKKDTAPAAHCFFIDDFDTDDLRRLANAAAELSDGLCCAFSGNDADGYRYVITSRRLPLRTLAKEWNRSLSGKGGGNDMMICGTYNVSRAVLEQFFGQII